MLRMTVLASGSKGNSTVLTSTLSGTSILVDAGLSCRELMKRMRFAGLDPACLSAVVVTHEHQDHVQGLGALARKLRVPVYVTGTTHEAWKRWVSPKAKRVTREQWFAQRRAAHVVEAENVLEELVSAALPAWQYVPQIMQVSAMAMAAAAAAPAPEFVAAMRQTAFAPADSEEVEMANPAELPGGVEYFEAGRAFAIRDIEVLPFTVPHDAADPVGFVFTIAGVRLGMVTDLGYMPSSVRVHLRGCDGLYLESNHDLEMLRDGPYPWSVKQRVMSRVGHLSNDALAEFLTTDYDGAAAFIVLAHLSEANNHPELARGAAQRALGGRANLLANKLMLAQQAAPLESIML